MTERSLPPTQVQKVRAWHCAACKYTTDTPHPACRAAGHELTRLSVSKRWWRCTGCSAHFSTVGVRYPASRCPKCAPKFVQFCSFI